MINRTKYRFVEIEFYLRNKMHFDMYMHANDAQLNSRAYYFYRFAIKGMDITFGDKKLIHTSEFQ